MAKTKTLFFCNACGYESPKWLGKCPSCGAWNSFAEEVVTKSDNDKNQWRSETSSRQAQPRKLSEITSASETRITTPDNELNRVLGGGIVPGSLVLIGGEPGIGKSTLMLQIGVGMHRLRTLYVSGEESEQQIKMRAERTIGKGKASDNFHVLTETNTRNIFAVVEELQPQLLIVDSIQTLYSPLLDSVSGS